MPHSSTDNKNTRQKTSRALKTISEAAELIDVPQHVLRFWETKFSQIKPLKRNGGRRFYRPEDIETLLQIKFLLYKQGYTIKGATKAFEQKTAQELREEFSAVGAGEYSLSANDNHSEHADDAAHADVQDVVRRLKDVSKQLRRGKSVH